MIDGYAVYPSFIEPEAHLVSKTYMTRVEDKNTRLRHPERSFAPKDPLLFQILRNAQTFDLFTIALSQV